LNELAALRVRVALRYGEVCLFGFRSHFMDSLSPAGGGGKGEGEQGGARWQRTKEQKGGKDKGAGRCITLYYM